MFRSDYNPNGLDRSRFEADDQFRDRLLHEALVSARTRDRDRLDTIPDDEETHPDPELGSTFRGH